MLHERGAGRGVDAGVRLPREWELRAGARRGGWGAGALGVAVAAGTGRGIVVPTETFFPVRTQSRLAELGGAGTGEWEELGMCCSSRRRPWCTGASTRCRCRRRFSRAASCASRSGCETNSRRAGGRGGLDAVHAGGGRVPLSGGATPAGRVRGERRVSTGEGTRGVRVTALVRPEFAHAAGTGLRPADARVSGGRCCPEPSPLSGPASAWKPPGATRCRGSHEQAAPRGVKVPSPWRRPHPARFREEERRSREEKPLVREEAMWLR